MARGRAVPGQHASYQSSNHYLTPNPTPLSMTGFVLWYAVPPLQTVTEYAGTAGSIACVYGIVLTLSSALMVGVYSFLGEPQLPRKLVMIGPYQLVRHPQILGNFLFIMGAWAWGVW